MTLLEQFRSARRVSTPLLSITTADQPNLIRTFTGALNGKAPAMVWDLVHGLYGMNQDGQQVLDALLGGQDPEAMTANPVEALRLAEKLPANACLFFQNAHRFLDNEGVSQAVCNLRDPFKTNERTLVLLAPVLRLPVELEQDVITLDEPLPDDAQLAEVVTGLYEAASLAAPDAATLDKAIAALRGLSAFGAEQITAMSLTKTGLDLDALWERKRAVIDSTPGLAVDRGPETFEGIGGLDRIKRFATGLFQGEDAPRVVVRLDEIEKMLAGIGGPNSPGDTSGTSQDALQVILTAMEDEEWTGIIALGIPGSGKSLVSKAIGNTFGVPTVAFDAGAMKGSLVGQSEQMIRQAVKVIKALAGPRRALFVATCNKLDVLPPELRRRFKLGLYYFDLPTAEERDHIWAIQIGRYGLSGYPRAEYPNDGLWTGADVRNCCEIAHRLHCSLAEAATYLVPVVESDPEAVEKLRRLANGRFLSPSQPGVYRMPTSERGPSRRSVSLNEGAGKEVRPRQ